MRNDFRVILAFLLYIFVISDIYKAMPAQYEAHERKRASEKTKTGQKNKTSVCVINHLKSVNNYVILKAVIIRGCKGFDEDNDIQAAGSAGQHFKLSDLNINANNNDLAYAA